MVPLGPFRVISRGRESGGAERRRKLSDAGKPILQLGGSSGAGPTRPAPGPGRHWRPGDPDCEVAAKL